MGTPTRIARAAALALLLLAVPVAGATAAETAGFPGLQKRLIGQSNKLVGYTAGFKVDAERYNRLAAATNYDYAELWSTQAATLKPLLAKMKRQWIAHNSDYERMEGIVAGTPSLVQYDVDIDAGASFKEDPKGAVSFSLKAPDGRTFKQPGALYNITEASLWGEDKSLTARTVKPDLDGDGTTGEFGEVLPDAAFLVAAAREFDRQSNKLLKSAKAYKPNTADALSALVVMVPTMGEYFGDWKNSRFVRGDKSTTTSFNVASRLNDIHDILGGLQVVYTDVRPTIATVDADQAAQTRKELDGLASFIERIYKREKAGHRFTPQDADLLGKQAQDRAVKVAGQVSQAAAKLGIKVQG
jgi:Imelysin